MDNITTSATKTGPCHLRVDVKIAQAHVAATYADVEKQFLLHAQIPGFRPGKTPKALLRKRFTAQIQEQTRADLINQGMRQLLSQKDLHIVTFPRLIDENKIEAKPASELAFTVEFDVRPDFTLPNYKGLKLVKAPVAVGDEEVDKFLTELAANRATPKAVDRASQAGDILKVGYEGKLAVSEEIPAAAQRLLVAPETWVMLAEPELIPGVNTALAGLTAGAEKQVDVSFPENFYEPFLAGKKASYTFKVAEVQMQVPPVLDEEFAKSLGLPSLEKLRSLVQEQLKQQKEHRNQDLLGEAVQKQLLEGQSFELPTQVLEMESQEQLREALYREHSQGRTAQDELEKKLPELRDQAAARAAERLRLRYLLEQIAELEAITVDDAEVEERLHAFRESRQLTEEQFRRRYDEYTVRHSMRSNLLYGRVFEKIISLAEVTEDPAAAALAEAAHVRAHGHGHDHQH